MHLIHAPRTECFQGARTGRCPSGASARSGQAAIAGGVGAIGPVERRVILYSTIVDMLTDRLWPEVPAIAQGHAPGGAVPVPDTNPRDLFGTGALRVA